MKKDSFFLKAVFAFAFLFTTTTAWSQTVIAGWTFPTTTGNAPASINAECGTHQSSSVLNLDNVGGASNWTNNHLTYTTGNAPQTVLCGVNTLTGGLRVFAGDLAGNNNKFFIFKISTLNFTNIRLKYDAYKSPIGFNTHTWSYSVDGNVYNDLPTVSLSQNSFQTKDVDFSSIPSLNNKNEVLLKLTLSGATTIIFADGHNRLDNIRFTGDPMVTTWNGTAWDYGAPRSGSTANFTGPYTTGTNGPSITAATVNINNGGSLELTSGYALNCSGAVTVNQGGNFIERDGSTKSIGSFTLNKTTTTSAGNKYVFWSSPVVGKNIYTIYPGFTSQYAMIYNPDTDYYPTMPNPTAAIAGVGYSVKVPVTATAAQFAGTPHSGNYSVNLDHTPNANGNTFNLIGNPYPSNLSLTSLYNGGTNGIDSSIYFWDHISATNTTQTGAGATTWAIFNAASGTWHQNGAAVPTVGTSVQSGQAFIVKAIGPSVTFNNEMRNAQTSNTYINKAVQNGNEGKFWLKLTAPNGAEKQTAITYGQGAQNTYEAFDSKLMGIDAVALYTVAENYKLGIQGRDYFVNTDVVIVGNKHSDAGSYMISLAGTTGLFAAGQAIYLRDKQTGVYTNLQTDSYTFTSDALEQQSRFEVVYMPQGALGTVETDQSETVVYKDGEHFTVRASEKILSIEIYDASGRLLRTQKPNRNTDNIMVNAKGMYIVKIKTTNGVTTKKILK